MAAGEPAGAGSSTNGASGGREITLKQLSSADVFITSQS